MPIDDLSNYLKVALLLIWSRPLALATSSLDSNFKTLDDLISVNLKENGSLFKQPSAFKDDPERFDARLGPIWVKWQLKWFEISFALFKILFVGVRIALISVTADFFPLNHLTLSMCLASHLRSLLIYPDNILTLRT